MKKAIIILYLIVALLGGWIGYTCYCDLRFDPNSSAGLIVAALGVMVTALVGWQVFNAIEIRDVIREFDGLKNKVESYNVNQRIALEKVDNLHTAYILFTESKKQNEPLSDRYLKAAQSANLFIKADVHPTDSRFTLAISQLEHVLELSESLPSERLGNFGSIHKELDGLYKSIMKELSSYKSDIERLINDINEGHKKRQNLCNPSQN